MNLFTTRFNLDRRYSNTVVFQPARGLDPLLDVRLIAASNRDLAVMVKQGAFREDLYFRLNVIDLKLPSLRERGGDIPLLIEHFYRRFSGNPNWTIDHVAPEAMKLLLDYPFPGNVRELRLDAGDRFAEQPEPLEELGV